MGVMQTIDLPSRYWAKVDQSSECWIWTGARNDSGYGVIGSMQKITGRSHEYAHRLMFWHSGQTLREGEVVDHSCGRGKDGCVTPAHLRPLKSEQNQREGHRHTKLVCDACGENRTPRNDGRGFYCVPCTAEYQKAYQEKNRDRLNEKRRLRRRAP